MDFGCCTPCVATLRTNGTISVATSSGRFRRNTHSQGCRSKPLGGGTSWWDVLVGNCHGFSGWSSEIPQNGDQNFVKSMYLVFENDIYIYIYVYTFVCSVFLPPPWYGSPGSTPFPSICKLLAAFLRSSLVFARFLQHFWLPASHLLGTCYLLDNLRSTHTPSKYIHTIHTIATIRTIHTKTNHTYIPTIHALLWYTSHTYHTYNTYHTHHTNHRCHTIQIYHTYNTYNTNHTCHTYHTYHTFQ